VFIILGTALFYFGGYFITKGVDVYTGNNVWNWMQYLLWSILGIFILYWIWRYYREVRSGQESAEIIRIEPESDITER
jgi:membrane protein implicated in regulation of membrane protease activity